MKIKVLFLSFLTLSLLSCVTKYQAVSEPTVYDVNTLSNINSWYLKLESVEDVITEIEDSYSEATIRKINADFSRTVQVYDDVYFNLWENDIDIVKDHTEQYDGIIGMYFVVDTSQIRITFYDLSENVLARIRIDNSRNDFNSMFVYQLPLSEMELSEFCADEIRQIIE